MAKKEENKNVLENQEALQEKVVGFEHWIESNSKVVFGLVGVAVLAVAGYFGFSYYKDNQNDIAQKEMFQAIRYFEADSLSLALNGDGNNLGFVAIIDDYSMTDAANLANYYSGVCYLKQCEFETAILYLKYFSSNDFLVQPRAYSLLGDAHMELDRFEEAASYYSKASNYMPNKYFTPAYLMKEALAYEKLNQNEKAIAAYDRIITEFFDSPEFTNAKKYKARLQKN